MVQLSYPKTFKYATNEIFNESNHQNLDEMQLIQFNDIP